MNLKKHEINFKGDLVRLSLLVKYGGVYLDASIILT
jgi:mannosyltransferase OCH1-like enzyme